MKAWKKYFCYMILQVMLLPGSALSQNYPVQITAQLAPPFSGYIGDYASAGEEKLRLLCLFTDFTKPQYNIKLKIAIQGQGITIQSKPYFFDGPHTLEPGVPLQLSGSDLFNLLNTQNLDFSGISKTQYEQKKVLPEGFYSICITAYDFNNPTPIQVSNTACAQAWMVLSDPPFLNLPACASTVAVTSPQQQTFSFTQMNMGSPNSAANTEYVFELWEIRPQGAVANNVVQSTPPVYSHTTSLTLVNYGITEPPLLPGMQYAWRVKARDISGRDLFKNNGYSQVCTFTYGSAFDGLEINFNLHAQAVSQRQIKVWWDSIATFTSYKLEFRKAGSGGNWFPVSTANCRTRILDLEPHTTYEFRVQGLSAEYTTPFSAPVNATTLPVPDYQCGELPSFPVTNFAPLKQANTKMIWQVGQFEMHVTQLVNTLSPNGQYSGYGEIRMPFINDVYCSFDKITVSDEHIVVQGKVHAVTTGIENWVNTNSMGTVQDGTAEPEIHTNIPLTTGDIQVNTNNGTVVIGGATYTYTPAGTTIADSNGNLFIVTADGQVIHAGTQGSGHGPVPESKNFIVTGKGTVAFTGGSKQLYGIDKYKHAALEHYYLKVRNLSSGTHEPVDWKSVMAQKYDVIDLAFQLQGGLKPDSILFRTGTGAVYKPQGTGLSRQLYIVAGKHGDVQELFACYRYNKDSLVNIAKINIVSYRNELNKVTLVPLGSGVSIDKAQLQKQLNEIYRQSVATWEVDVAPAVAAGDTLWDKDGNGRINTGSNLFTRYSSELRAINKYIRSQSYYKAGEYYLVVTGKPTDSLQPGLMGEMPRGRNIGYLFTGAPTATLVAHELGHGAFVLEHSFEGNASMPKGNSGCLMDYNSGTDLYKGKYWDHVHEPVAVIGLLEDDDDGASAASNQEVLAWLNKIKLSFRDNSKLTVATKEMVQFSKGYVNGTHYDFIKVMLNAPAAPVVFSAPGKMKATVISAVTPAGYMPAACLDFNDGALQLITPADRLAILSDYLQGKSSGRNLLLFVNGYRSNIGLSENPKPADEVTFTDVNGYWAGMDAMFINRIGTRNVLYADGHHSVATSNHADQGLFLLNLKEWACASNLGLAGYAALCGQLNASINCAAYYHNSNKFKLHTTSNANGFKERRDNGRKAGLDLLSKINSGLISFDISKDSIDIVSHSMGYAYALGIIDALQGSGKKFKFGRFYSIAPENAKAGGADWKNFEEVWQYGSNEAKDQVWEQDGVAPQSPMPDITKLYPKTRTGRVNFPDDVNPKKFLECHYIDYYFWIFSRLGKDDKGYVSARH